MLNICFVKFGDKVQGFDADKLLYDMIEPIINNVKEDFEIWVATDRPIYNITLNPKINYIPLTNQDIKEHGHWTKIFFFDPSYIKAKEGDTTVIMDIDMQWQNDPSPVITYPVEDGQLVSMDRWWKDNEMPISGNLYKFKSYDFQFVYEQYINNFKYIRPYYYKEGIVAHIQVHDELDISVEDDKKAKRIKEINPDAIIVFGGPQVSEFRLEEQQEEFHWVDSWIVSEGELSFEKLINELRETGTIQNQKPYLDYIYKD